MANASFDFAQDAYQKVGRKLPTRAKHPERSVA